MAAAAGIAGTRIAADAAGVRAAEDVYRLVNRDATVRALEIIQEAAKHMRACRRARLLPEDINYALTSRGQDPVHIVVDPEENLRFRRADAGTRTIFYIPADNDVDVADLLHLPLPPAPVAPTLRSSWLALDGRAVPQDDLEVNYTGVADQPVPSITSPTSADPPSSSAPAAAAAAAGAVIPTTAATGSPAATLARISPHSFCLFRALARAFASPGREAARAAILTVSVGALRPLLVAYVELAAELTASAATVDAEAAARGRSEVLVLLYAAVSVAVAVMSASFTQASLQPYAHLLIGPLLTAATGAPRAYPGSAPKVPSFTSVVDVSPPTGDVDGVVLRQVAAAALGAVAVRYGELLVALPQRLASSLLATALAPASPANAVVGALGALGALGPACVSATLLAAVGGVPNLAIIATLHGSREAADAAAGPAGRYAATAAAAAVRSALAVAVAVAMRAAAVELRAALQLLAQHDSATDSARAAAAVEALGRTLGLSVGHTLGGAWASAAAVLGSEYLVHATGLMDVIGALSSRRGVFGGAQRHDVSVTAMLEGPADPAVLQRPCMRLVVHACAVSACVSVVYD